MKKTLLTIGLSMLGAMVLAVPAMAVTTVSFSPVSVSAVSGKTFNVVIVVNPQGVANYTEKIELTYPADILEVRSFNFGGSWMPLSQTGYDLIDNTNGVLVKTAGYPGGLSSATTFGTVSFYAKKAGSGTITIGNNSLAFEASSQNAISGSPVSFTITTPVSVPVAPKSPTTPSTVETPTTAQPATEQPIVEQPTAQVSQPTLMAAMGTLLTLGTGNIWLGILIGLIILAGLIYVIYLLRKKNNSGSM
jgi:hypothetical protein